MGEWGYYHPNSSDKHLELPQKAREIQAKVIEEFESQVVSVKKKQKYVSDPEYVLDLGFRLLCMN